MSFSFGKQKQSQQADTKSVTDPWAPTQPLLKSILGDLEGARGQLDPSGIISAIDKAKLNLGATGDASRSYQLIGKDAIDTPDYTPEVDEAWGDYKGRLTPTADGKNLDLNENPYLQGILQQVGDDAQGRVNAQFAGAGRDLSGANNIEVGRGVTQAQMPILFDQYNREQGRTDAAARDLYSGGLSRTTTKGALDEARAKLRQGGADAIATGEALGRDGDQAAIDLERMRSQVPIEQMGWLTSLLYPMAGLGQQSAGSAVTTGQKTAFGAKAELKDLGKILSMLG